MIPSSIQLLSLNDIGCKEELPETAETLEENAVQKARYVFDKYGYACFADDSGLEVQELDGAPGVYSARYAGPEADFVKNIRKLLNEMDGKENRSASFRTVIALLLKDRNPDEPLLFEGTVNGQITEIQRGAKGFGYDPVFIPEGFHVTYSEMAPELKNKISHRAKAVEKLTEFLKISV